MPSDPNPDEVDTDSTLPDEIIFNILSRLPVKTLCKFRCVSKQWLSSISDSHFKRKHRDCSKNNPRLLVVNYKTESFYLPVEVFTTDIDGLNHHNFPIFDSKFWPLRSRRDNHLICFTDNNKFYVWNPSTQEVLSLPQHTPSIRHALTVSFGYMPLSNEYVLIHLLDIGCELLKFSDGSARNCCWKPVESNCPLRVDDFSQLFFENAFYWMQEFSAESIEPIFIIRFDLEKEVFDTVSTPEGWSYTYYAFARLVELKGFLCLVDYESEYDTQMNIWMMKDLENQQWFKEYIIDYTLLNPRTGIITPLYIWDGEILMNTGCSIAYYKIENKSFRRIHSLTEGVITWACLYIDSFFSLGSASRCTGV